MDLLGSQPHEVTVDRRQGPQRRSRRTPPFSRYTFCGRRRRNRRRTDPQKRYYVDQATGPYAWALVCVAALISFDTFSTLHFLGLGGQEANPLMAWLYGQGTGWFLLAKFTPLVLAIPLLAVHMYFAVGRCGTAVLLLCYGWIFTVHVWMLQQISH